jgi:hypothetical protein
MVLRQKRHKPLRTAFVVYVVNVVQRESIVPSYLEIALRAAAHEQQPMRSEPERVHQAIELIAEARQSSASAACGSPHCAGCYDVGDGKKIHPPKCGEDYRAWLERWEAKGKVQ